MDFWTIKRILEIGGYSFQSCNAIENFTIPDGVISIGKYAFVFCGNLKL